MIVLFLPSLSLNFKISFPSLIELSGTYDVTLKRSDASESQRKALNIPALITIFTVVLFLSVCYVITVNTFYQNKEGSSSGQSSEHLLIIHCVLDTILGKRRI